MKQLLLNPKTRRLLVFLTLVNLIFTAVISIILGVAVNMTPLPESPVSSINLTELTWTYTNYIQFATLFIMAAQCLYLLTRLFAKPAQTPDPNPKTNQVEIVIFS